MKSSPTTIQARPGLPGTAAPANSSHDHIMPPPKSLRRFLTGIAPALAVFALAVTGTARADKIIDALFTDTSQICSAANTPYFGALTQNVAAVNLTYYSNTGINSSQNQEGNYGAYAGGTLNGIGFHNILLGGSYSGTATGVTVANALPGVTMDYSLSGGGCRLMNKAVITGPDAAVAYNVSASNWYRAGADTTTITLHGLAPNNAVYVQLIGGEHGWNATPSVSLNGGTAVAWNSIKPTTFTGNPALLGITGTTDASGKLLITMTGPNYYGLAAVTVAQQIPPTSTTTTVTSSGNPSIVGDSVTFTATIAPASGTVVPAGTVQFKVGGSTLGSPVAVTAAGGGTYNGAASSIATTTLPVGAHVVTAEFTATGIFSSSTGTLIGGQSVNSPTDIATTTAVISSANPSIYGNSVTFTATVAPASGTVVPTGTVQFLVDGTTLDSPVTVTAAGGGTYNGTASSSATSTLPVGAHTVTAEYTADSGFGSSLGTLSGDQTVNPAATTTTLVLSSGSIPSAYGDSLSFGVTVSGSDPTGTVTLKDGGASGTTIGTGTLLVGGICTITPAATALTAGTHDNIVAVYGGDTTHATSTSTALSQTVNKATPVVTVTVGSYTYNGSAQGPNTATTGGSTGAVTYTYSGTSYGAVPYGPSSVRPTNGGTYTATATAAADANYYQASSDPTAFTTAKATPVITWANPSAIIVGTALSSTQLNATCPVPGNPMIYTPPSDTVLLVGDGQTLSVEFTPTDTNNYNTPVTKTVTIDVKPVGSAIITDSQWKGTGTHYGVSATDLIDASQTTTFSSIALTSGSAWFGSSANMLNDGSEGFGANANTGPSLVPQNGSVVTVILNTSVNTAGYNITSIISLTGEADGTDRISQKYNVEYHVVGGGWTTLAGDSGATVARSFTQLTGNQYQGEMQVTISGLILTGVDQLRFTFYDNPSNAAYREIDVFGTPTAGAGSNYDTWANRTFANGPLTDKNPAHDPDGDGLTNFQEFAFGLDPTAGASCNPVTPLIGNQFTYTRYKDSGLNYTVEFSTDLAGWAKAASTDDGGSTPDANGVQIVTVKVTNEPLNGKLFVRVRAE